MKSNKKIKVGIIGVTPERGWAGMSHVPALKVLSGYEITALSTRRKENISALRNIVDAPHICESVKELVSCPDVDLTVVSVKVPLHYDIIKEAFSAGKDVLSEWPLGKNLQEAEELAGMAREKNLQGYIMLQSRAVPAIRYVRDFISQGNIGEVLSTNMIGSGIIYGEYILKANDYTADPENGTGMINVTFGNAVDALAYVLGEFTELSATTAIRRKTSTMVETGQEVPVGTADQVAVTGTLQGGAVASIHFRGGTFPGTNFFWEINGTKGDIQISASGGSLAVFDVTVKASTGKDGTMEILDIPDEYDLLPDKNLSNIPRNVGQIYQLIQQGMAPTFSDAVIRHRMIDAIQVAAATGTRQSYSLEKERY
jgi:predicted dehydrogenase